MSSEVESELNFVGEVLKGSSVIKELTWTRRSERRVTHLFVPTLMSIYSTHLLFHLSRDRCLHSNQLCSYMLFFA